MLRFSRADAPGEDVYINPSLVEAVQRHVNRIGSAVTAIKLASGATVEVLQDRDDVAREITDRLNVLASA